MSKAYESAGVNIDAGYEGVRRIKKHVESTRRPEVLGGLGSFGGLFDLSSFSYKEPVLVSGTDGVGTKLLIAQETGIHDTIGIDAVAMCVNDIVVQGASPLFFLDYLALGKNEPEMVENIVAGIAEGCRQAGCALIGGETAEMPGLYKPEEYDVAGFVVGIAEKSKMFNPQNVQEGDMLIGVASSGIHSNGYSLVRKIVSDNYYSWNDPFQDSGKTLGEVLLAPTKIYVKALQPFFSGDRVKAAAHITGGGLIENVPRMLPEGLGAEINTAAWEVPQVFKWLQEKGNLSHEDLYETFNMGIGLVLSVREEDVQYVMDTLHDKGETAFVIGKVKLGSAIEFAAEGDR
ncbi:phosphoribosylformylglycinamidine cyclo-ligase [Evansella clarkii]|uniref:phosphoribosylformylglycinamidine cyclo-ligase n=1 Tax=Evansella clarkii TaxID=79879 RepID=UPI000B4353D7|nr:phosphoribosylformylglycinamidine cyclo-ligase [Evansella clarkii]